jgi:hypothetical protein
MASIVVKYMPSYVGVVLWIASLENVQGKGGVYVLHFSSEAKAAPDK